MSSEKTPPPDALPEISPCSLKCLAKRPQIDFEIDFFEQILGRNPHYTDALKVLGDLLSQKGCHRRALQMDVRLCQLLPQDPVVMYNLACTYAVLKQPQESLQMLRRAFELGYRDIEHLLEDDDLKSLHELPEFRQLLVELLQADGNPTRIV